jgi:hypothetical protein
MARPVLLTKERHTRTLFGMFRCCALRSVDLKLDIVNEAHDRHPILTPDFKSQFAEVFSGNRVQQVVRFWPDTQTIAKDSFFKARIRKSWDFNFNHFRFSFEAHGNYPKIEYQKCIFDTHGTLDLGKPGMNLRYFEWNNNHHYFKRHRSMIRNSSQKRWVPPLTTVWFYKHSRIQSPAHVDSSTGRRSYH